VSTRATVGEVESSAAAELQPRPASAFFQAVVCDRAPSCTSPRVDGPLDTSARDAGASSGTPVRGRGARLVLHLLGFGLAFIVLSARAVHAQPTGGGRSGAEARVAHIAKALAELTSDAIALDRTIYEAVRLQCKPVTLACMLTVARARCAERGCMAAADVIVTNQHAERDVLDDMTRMKLVRTTSDYHAAVLAEVREKVQRVLAAELVLARPAPSVAARIDRVCVERDHVAARRCERGTPACVASVPYNRCVAALVWFVSTESRTEDGPR
jgi:hypothetical protein